MSGALDFDLVAILCDVGELGRGGGSPWPPLPLPIMHGVKPIRPTLSVCGYTLFGMY